MFAITFAVAVSLYLFLMLVFCLAWGYKFFLNFLTIKLNLQLLKMSTYSTRYDRVELLLMSTAKNINNIKKKNLLSLHASMTY